MRNEGDVALRIPRSTTHIPVVPWRLPRPDTYARLEAYRAALAHLYAFSEVPRSSDDVRLSRVRKLERMRTLLGLLGAPQMRYSTVLIAGTKGKGSMAAILTSILEAAGYRVGRYTQPHLYSYRERIWACGHYVTEAEAAEELAEMAPALTLVERSRGRLGHLTTFDVGTAQALQHFADAGIDIAVVEVGVGGANDATNALEPVLALIGQVDLDHTAALGENLGAIAREKAGVVRFGIDVVVAPQAPEAMAAIRQRAEGVARIQLAKARPHPNDWRFPEREGTFAVCGPLGVVEGLATPLVGRHQQANVAMAVGAAQLLDARGWRVGEGAIREGVAQVHWPGRFQTVVREPLTIVDGAHNPCAARALAATVRECHPERPVTLVLGMTTDKDAGATIRELAPVISGVVATRSRHPRACEPEGLAAIVESLGLEATIVGSPAAAVCHAWETQPSDGMTLVAGSLFLAGDVLEWLWAAGKVEDDDG